MDALYLSNFQHQVPILAANFGLYEKYFVHSMALEFVPSQPVTVGGTVSIAPDYDPLDPMPATTAALSQSQGFKSGPVSAPLKVQMPNYRGPDGSFVRPDLYCAPTNDDRLTSFGQFKCFGVAPTLTQGDVLGKLILHYDVTFHILEPKTTLAVAGSGVTKLMASGNAAVFTPTSTLSTTMSDAITFKDGSGAVSIPAGDLLFGIISAIGTGLNLTTVAGKAINIGTRIFLRPALAKIETTTYTNLDSSNYVGQMSTSRNFSPMSNIVMNLLNGIEILLNDVGTMV